MTTQARKKKSGKTTTRATKKRKKRKKALKAASRRGPKRRAAATGRGKTTNPGRVSTKKPKRGNKKGASKAGRTRQPKARSSGSTGGLGFAHATKPVFIEYGLSREAPPPRGYAFGRLRGSEVIAEFGSVPQFEAFVARSAGTTRTRHSERTAEAKVEKRAIEALAQQAEQFAGELYSDLEGHHLTGPQYAKRLRDDPDFASREVTKIVQENARRRVPVENTSGITPAEQRTLAKSFVEFRAKVGREDGSFRAFLKRRPTVTQAFSREDVSRIRDTAAFELGEDIEPIDDDLWADVVGDQAPPARR